jgi:molybdopterin-containing oxidoreductase family membrane subunit
MDHIKYLFVGLHGHGKLVPFMWTSMALMVLAIIMLIPPRFRANEGLLAISCVMVFLGTWIDKGLGMISGGFVPNPLHEINEYVPTIPELIITLGVWAAGFLVLTLLFKITVGVKEEVHA